MTTQLFTTGHDHTLTMELARLRALPPIPAFSKPATRFVSDFTRRIRDLPELRAFPELATLSHWFRPAAIERLAHAQASHFDTMTLPRGLVFHMAPANVDVLFAYTWLLSVLAGNSNVARLSQKPSQQRDALIGLLQTMRRDGSHENILDRNVLLTYSHDDELTTEISLQCHARIIWGGDQTVSRIRSLPLAPLAIERAFPDRFGVAILHAPTFAEASDDELADLAHRFCNDTLWFSQQACSSPRTVFWLGNETVIQHAQHRFWPQVFKAADRHDNEPAALMARVTDAHLMSSRAHSLQLVGTLDQFPLRLSASFADGDMREQQSGFGLVVEVALAQLDNLAEQLDDRDQTLVVHGFTASDLRQFLAKLRNRAIDRIVPLGRALDFHPIWDGNNLMEVLTRQITCPVH